VTATATGMDAAFGPEHVVRRPVRTARAPGVASDFLAFAFSAPVFGRRLPPC